MTRMTISNWNKFFTDNKETTIRTHIIKPGIHSVLGGGRYHPIHLGKIDVRPHIKTVEVGLLGESDAINDGFPTLTDLLLELGKLNKDITSETIVYIQPCKVVEGEFYDAK